MAQENKSSTRITVRATLSYSSLFKPSVNPKRPDDKPKFNALLLFDKDDEANNAKIRGAIKAVEAKMITEKYSGKAPKKAITNTFRDGDEEREEEEYENRFFMNVWKYSKPATVDRKLKPITDEAEIYRGIVVNVCIDFYYYFGTESKGITASLEAIQKIKDGEPLGASRVKAEDVFQAEEDDDEDYEDMD